MIEAGLCSRQPALCLNLLTAIAGYNPGNLDAGRLPVYLAHTPAGTSVQNMVHWAQVRCRPGETLLRRATV